MKLIPSVQGISNQRYEIQWLEQDTILKFFCMGLINSHANLSMGSISNPYICYPHILYVLSDNPEGSDLWVIVGLQYGILGYKEAGDGLFGSSGMSKVTIYFTVSVAELDVSYQWLCQG